MKLKINTRIYDAEEVINPENPFTKRLKITNELDKFDELFFEHWQYNAWELFYAKDYKRDILYTEGDEKFGNRGIFKGCFAKIKENSVFIYWDYWEKLI